jgi:hypothetical protein
MTRILSTLSTALIILSLTSCGASEQQSSSIEVNTTAEGPFFMGANSLIADYEVSLDNLIEGRSIKAEEIHSIQLSGVSVTLDDDSLTLADMNSVTLQLVGKDAPMTTVAVRNPISEGGQSTTLVASDEADLTPYFKDSKFTFVLDLDFKDDAYVDQVNASVKVDLTISLK